jgi:Carboxypeptidase regulatory-like domain/TonB dependent receptor
MSVRSFRNSCAAITLIVMLGGGATAAAQTVTGTIQGTVVDTSGGVLPGATVTIRQTDTGAERVVVTNEGGIYQAPYLPIGRYTITATLTSFGTITRAGIQLGLNETRVVDFRLDPKVTESVTVTGDAPPINRTDGTIKGSLTAEEIMDMPTTNAGNFLALAQVFPGFQDNPTSGQNNPTLSSGSSINFGNSGTRGATFQINGVNNDDSSENQNRQGAALSTIQEFQILKNSYSAEFGRGDGAVVLVQTKSGTNKRHGDFYLNQQDSKWNARSWFSPPGSQKPERQRSEYGFTVGFPIVLNKVLAFGSLHRVKLDGENGYTRDFFTPEELAAPRLTRGNDTPANRAWIQSVIDRFPSSFGVPDPRNVRTFTGVRGINQPDQDYSARVDYNISRGNTVWARYQWTNQIRESEEIIVGEGTKQDNTQQNLGMTWTRVFNSRIVGEARYGLGLRSTNVNIAAGNDTPVIRFQQSPVAGSTIGDAGAFPINRDQTDHQFVYNLTTQWFRTHSLKMGTDIRHQQLDDFADNFSRGFWNFNRVCDGVTYSTAFAAMLDGCISTFQKAYGPLFLENRMNESNVYAQDDWRVFDTLTLNLGVRYEYVAAPREAKNRIDYIFGADRNNVEPRLAFAYAPKWDSGWLGALSGGTGNFSVRGGWGVNDGRIFQSIFSQGGASVRFNPPNAILKPFAATPAERLNVSDPTLGFVFVPGPQIGRVSLTLPDPNLEMPSTSKWNLTVERVMPLNSSIRITYSGNHNDKRLKYTQANLPASPIFGPVLVVDHPNNAPATGHPDLRGKYITKIAADVNCAGTGFFPGVNVSAACPNPVPLADDEISARVTRADLRRPNPLYSTNLLISNEAESWYDGLEIEWLKRLSRGLSFQAAYTYSKSLDTTSEATAVGAGDSNFTGPNKQYSKAYSRFHTPHRFTFNGSYRLPFFAQQRGVLGQALGGWQLSGLLRLASGTPFTITDTSRDLDFDGYSEARPVILDRSILNAHVTHRDTSQQILRADAFRSTTLFDTIADLVPRNSFFADGVNNVDLALSKTFRMPWDGQRMDVRIEAFNVFNTVQFGFPNLDSTSTTFGVINGVATGYSARVVQLKLRYVY